MCVLKTRRKSVDGTSDLSERKFKFLAGKSHKNPKQKMMQKSQPTKEKEEERERHTRARY